MYVPCKLMDSMETCFLSGKKSCYDNVLVRKGSAFACSAERRAITIQKRTGKGFFGAIKDKYSNC